MRRFWFLSATMALSLSAHAEGDHSEKLNALLRDKLLADGFPCSRIASVAKSQLPRVYQISCDGPGTQSGNPIYMLDSSSGGVSASAGSALSGAMPRPRQGSAAEVERTKTIALLLKHRFAKSGRDNQRLSAGGPIGAARSLTRSPDLQGARTIQQVGERREGRPVAVTLPSIETRRKIAARVQAPDRMALIDRERFFSDLQRRVVTVTFHLRPERSLRRSTKSRAVANSAPEVVRARVGGQSGAEDSSRQDIPTIRLRQRV